MKHNIVYLAVALLLSACTFYPAINKEIVTRRVSPDYIATGNIEEARAYVYGKVTLLEFGNSIPFFLAIRDENGTSIDYKMVGRYYRLARIVDNFTVWADGQTITFSLFDHARVTEEPLIAP